MKVNTQRLRSTGTTTFLFVVLLFLLGLGAGCSKTDDSLAIQRLIEEGVILAEAHDLSGLMDLTSDAFIAEPGSYPWKEAKRFLFVGMKRYGNFRILHPQASIAMDKDKLHARATLHFLIVRKEQTVPGLKDLYNDPLGWLQVVDRNADLFTLSLSLRLEGRDWLVHRAKLTRFAGVTGRD